MNKWIIEDFNLPYFPIPAIVESGAGFTSCTDFLKEFINNNKGEEFFAGLKLYPDQLVYLGGKLGSEIIIDAASQSIIYRTGEQEARTIEETMLGVAYVTEAIRKSGFTLKQMNEKDAAFINSWESEKYRKSIVGKQGV